MASAREAAAAPTGGARVAMIRNLGLLWTGQVLSKGIAFVALATLARRLSPHSYGAIEYALGMSAFAWLVIDGGLGAVGVRRLSQHAEPAEALAAEIPAAQICLALLVAPAMFGLAWVSAQDRTTLTLIGAMAVSILMLPFKQDWLFQAQGRMTHVAIAQIVRVVVFAVLAITLIWGDEHTSWIGMVEIVSVAATTLYLMLMQAISITPIRVSFRWSAMRDLAREGLPIGAGAICWAATQFVPLFVLTPLAGLEPTAYFGAAHRLGVSLVTFSWIYHFNLFPTIARRIRDAGAGAEPLLDLSMRVTAWGGIGLALTLTLAAPALLPMLFGKGFVRAALPFAILVWTFPLTLLSGHARWLLVAAERSSDMLVSQALGVVVALAASGLLVPGLGASGAAAAMTLACLAVWLSSQMLADRRGRHVPLRPCLPPIAAAGLVLVAAKVSGADPWIAATTGGVAFAAIGLVLDRHLLADVQWIVAGRSRVPSMAGEGAK